MADTIFTGNGNGILTIFSGNTDFAINTIDAVFTVRASNGYAILAVFAYLDRVRTDSIIHENGNRRLAIFILCNRRRQVISTIGMAVFCLRADDINGTVQLVANRVRAIFNSCVGTEFQTVVQCCHRMRCRAGFAVFAILIDDSCDAIRAINARCAVGTIRAILADSLDNGSYTAISTILARDTNLAVFPILARYGHGLGLQVIGQLEGYTAICSCRYDLIIRTIESYSLAEFVLAAGVIVPGVFQVHRTGCLAVIHRQVIIMAGGIRVIGVLINYSNCTITGFYGCLAGIGNMLHVADVGSVGIYVIGIGRAIDATAHVVHLIATELNIPIFDDNVFVGIVVRILDSNAVVFHSGVAGGDAVQAFQVLRQFQFQFAVVPSLGSHHADVLFIGNQIVRVGFPAGDRDFLVQLHGRVALIASKIQMGVIQGILHLFQLGHVHGVRIVRAGCQIGQLTGLGTVGIADGDRAGRGSPGAGLVHRSGFQIGVFYGTVFFVARLPGGGGLVTQSHSPVHIGTGRSPQSRRIGSRRSGVIPQSHRLRSIVGRSTGRSGIRFVNAGQGAETDGHTVAPVHLRAAADGHRRGFRGVGIIPDGQRRILRGFRMGTKSDGMLAGRLRIRTDGHSAFPGGRGLGQVRIVFFNAPFGDLSFDPKADGQGSGAGGFRIFTDGHRNCVVLIIGFCIFTKGNGIGRGSGAAQPG